VGRKKKIEGADVVEVESSEAQESWRGSGSISARPARPYESYISFRARSARRRVSESPDYYYAAP